MTRRRGIGDAMYMHTSKYVVCMAVAMKMKSSDPFRGALIFRESAILTAPCDGSQKFICFVAKVIAKWVRIAMQVRGGQAW
jgi:hypothetical protein